VGEFEELLLLLVVDSESNIFRDIVVLRLRKLESKFRDVIFLLFDLFFCDLERFLLFFFEGKEFTGEGFDSFVFFFDIIFYGCERFFALISCLLSSS